VATVYQRGGVYYAKYFDSDGNRVSKNTGASRKRDAQKIAAEMEVQALQERRRTTDKCRHYSTILETAVREANAGELTLARSEELLRRLRAVANPDFREVSVDEWFGTWIDRQRPHIGKSTAASYEDARRRLNAAWGATKSKGPLTELTNTDVRHAVGRVAKKVRAATANMDLAVLRRVLEVATVERLVTANVAKSVRYRCIGRVAGVGSSGGPHRVATERRPFPASQQHRGDRHHHPPEKDRPLQAYGPRSDDPTCRRVGRCEEGCSIPEAEHQNYPNPQYDIRPPADKGRRSS
jgi:hypothetical protein